MVNLHTLMLFNANHPSLIAIMLFSVLAARGQTQPPENTDLGKTTPGPVFRTGGGVSAPKAIYTPDPEYSKEALAANYGGTCVLWLVVGPDGKPRDIRVLRTLGSGLDEQAIEAVKNWRFAPAMKDGKPVAVQIDVYVNFLPYGKELKTRILELQKKVNAGDPKAELELSSSYFAGRDVPQNEVRGLELLQRAANQGLAQAQFLMGEHAYADARQEDRQGASSSADYVKAYMWYELALRGGYKQSEKMLKELAPKMSPEQLSDAKTRADNWPNAPTK
jgi:TonB family protein